MITIKNVSVLVGLFLAVALGMSYLGGVAKAQADEAPVSGAEIVCEIYEYLVSQGLPIPPGLDASGCEGGGGGGGGPTPGPTQCSDFIDNDGDGKIDYLPANSLGDPDCDNLLDDSEGPTAPPAAACADGVDNDSDNLVDMADPGCADANDTDESNPADGGGDSGGGTPPGGGGGGPAPACEDSIDNDGDGFIDAADPGCDGPADTDELNAPSSGGGGGGSGGGSSAATTTQETSSTATSTSVATTTPTTLTCDTYLTAFIKAGNKNDEEQVKRLQKVLKEFENMDVEENGVYDAKTLAAVHAFQSKYASDILTPWGASKSTGYVFLTTRKKVNEIYCKFTKEFPLSSEESEAIAKVRTLSTQTTVAPRSSIPAENKPASSQETQEDNSEETATVGSAEVTTQTASVGEAVERPLSRILRPISSFFGRMFGRGE